MGPAIVPQGNQTYEILSEITEHVCFGNNIKYVPGVDMGFFQVLNNSGDVIFTCPTNMLLSCLASTEEFEPKIAESVPIRGTNTHLRGAHESD
jgi:hypothetical protein